MNTATKRGYSLAEAAADWGVSKDVLRRAIHRGELAAKKSGKNEDGDPVGNFIIHVSDLEDWFKGLPDA